MVGQHGALSTYQSLYTVNHLYPPPHLLPLIPIITPAGESDQAALNELWIIESAGLDPTPSPQQAAGHGALSPTPTCGGYRGPG